MTFISILSIFTLACFVGYYVVWQVTPALHTPLMAVTNATSSVNRRRADRQRNRRLADRQVARAARGRSQKRSSQHPKDHVRASARKAMTIARKGARGGLLALMIANGACQFVPGTEAKAIADAKEQISEELIDPSSAQFRRVVHALDEPLTICGEINGKNRMGAYTGFKRFIVAPSVNMHQISLDHKPESGRTGDDEAAMTENQYWFDHAWKNGCEAAVAAS